MRVNLAGERDATLTDLLRHGNDWFVRHARRLLQEQAAAERRPRQPGSGAGKSSRPIPTRACGGWLASWPCGSAIRGSCRRCGRSWPMHRPAPPPAARPWPRWSPRRTAACRHCCTASSPIRRSETKRSKPWRLCRATTRPRRSSRLIRPCRQTPTERVTVSLDDIETRVLSPQSLMPENQLAQLSPEAARDLVAYLRHPTQVPLPGR